MSIQPLLLTHFNEILLALEFQFTKFIVGAFSFKAHFRPQIFCNEMMMSLLQARMSMVVMMILLQARISMELMMSFLQVRMSMEVMMIFL